MQEFILGGYTKHANDGLYKIDFDAKTAEFTNKTLIAKLENPTYVCLDESKTYLFAINTKAEGEAGIVAFKKDAEGEFKKVDEIYPFSNAACHLSFREQSKTIYAANYHLGQIEVYSFKNERLSHIQTIEQSGRSIHPNQDSSHIHFVGFNNYETLLFAADLGADTVSTYDVDRAGYLSLASVAELPAGTGPRHLVLSKDQKFMFVNGELNSTTNVFSVSRTGQLKLLDTYLNIPEEEVSHAASAAIRLSSDDRFLYVSSRYFNKITVFKVDRNEGKLERIQVIDAFGKVPRDFNFDYTENYLLVAHRDSPKLVVFNRDKQSGKLSLNNRDARADECVCIAQA